MNNNKILLIFCISDKIVIKLSVLEFILMLIALSDFALNWFYKFLY